MVVEPESANTFARRFRGYDPAAVDAHMEMLTTKQQLVLDDVESLRARLKELGDEAAGLRKEAALLTETSPAPHAMQQRMANMLRRAVDEVAEMQTEARAEAAALIAAAEAEIEVEQLKHEDRLAELVARQEAMEAAHAESKEKLEAELAGIREDAEQEREQLLADVRLEADHYREQARRSADDATQQRVKVLEQLMGVYRDLEAVPADLESAYQELKNPSED
ncbi:MAG TPA: cell division protein DivIVA [Mycobacterium sp.]|jgi:cell division septum initiation protein DivIVA|uniref:cell division protein DivIVA n=1 Tax=Mycobacterium sp. TaxID=1785 RepID=UPI002F42037A